MGEEKKNENKTKRKACDHCVFDIAEGVFS